MTTLLLPRYAELPDTVSGRRLRTGRGIRAPISVNTVCDDRTDRRAITIRRMGVAQLLDRVTCQGIYRDTVLLGRKAPVPEPLLNADGTGQVGTLNAISRERLQSFRGDAARL